MKFSNGIKEIRKQCLMSQSDFAKELGVSFSTVNRWETGKTLPTYKAMKNIEMFCAQYNIGFENFKEAWKEEK